MSGLISYKNALRITLVIAGLLVVFHLSIILGMVIFDFAPVAYLWGGRMETSTQLLQFEMVSLVVALLFVVLLLIKAGRINFPALNGVAHIAMWLFFILFLFNTAGNVVAKTNFEKSFALITGLLAFLLWRIVREKKIGNET